MEKWFVCIETAYGRVIEEVETYVKAHALFKAAAAYGHVAAIGAGTVAPWKV